jgi:CBS domain containing-hemolysin-like protein
VAHRAGQGDFNARIAIFLMNHKDRFLSTILIGNNICNVGATLVFVALFMQMDAWVPLDLSRIPSPESWFLTPLMVLFGEMLPKSLYRTYSFRLTLRSIPVMGVLYFLFLPFTWLLSLGSVFVKKSERGSSYRTKAREEMVLMAGEGARRGTLFESANIVMENTLRFKDRVLKELVIGMPQWQENHPVLSQAQTVGSARLQVGRDSEVIVFSQETGVPVGVVGVTDLAAANPDSTLVNVASPLPVLYSDMTILNCLRKIGESAPRFFLVKDVEGAGFGVLDKMDLFEAVFSKLTVNYSV